MSNEYGNYGGGNYPPPGGPNQGQGGGYPPPAGGPYGPPGNYPPPAGGPYGQPGNYPPQPYNQPGYTQPVPHYSGYGSGGPAGPTPPKKSNTPLILGGVGALALIAVAVTAFLVLGNRSNTTITEVGQNTPVATVTATPAVTTAAATATTAASQPTATIAARATTVAALPTATRSTLPTATRAALPTATRSAATPAATSRPATAGASTNKVADYPGAKSVDLPPALQQQFTNAVGSGAKNAKLNAFLTADDSDKVKTFYTNEFTKAGWIDASSLAAQQLQPITQLGGWAVAYAKVPDIALIILLPGALAQSGELGVKPAAGENVVLVITGVSA